MWHWVGVGSVSSNEISRVFPNYIMLHVIHIINPISCSTLSLTLMSFKWPSCKQEHSKSSIIVSREPAKWLIYSSFTYWIENETTLSIINRYHVGWGAVELWSDFFGFVSVYDFSFFLSYFGDSQYVPARPGQPSLSLHAHPYQLFKIWQPREPDPGLIPIILWPY